MNYYCSLAEFAKSKWKGDRNIQGKLVILLKFLHTCFPRSLTNNQHGVSASIIQFIPFYEGKGRTYWHPNHIVFGLHSCGDNPTICFSVALDNFNHLEASNFSLHQIPNSP
jgi:hypothetical protein